MENVYDVIIVGAGPAGSSCASFLAGNGHKILLVDKAKFPRDKTCGDGITGKSASMLDELGLIGEVARNDHAAVKGALITSPDGSSVTVKADENGLPNYVCRRQVFDNILFSKAKSFENVEVWEEFTVTDVMQENSCVTGIKGVGASKEERTAKAKIVVGADGALSVVRQKLVCKKLEEKHTMVAVRAYFRNVSGGGDNYEFHFLDSLLPGYFWIFPLENGLSNIGLGTIVTDKEKKGINLKDALFDITKNEPRFKERFEGAELAGEVKGWVLPLGSSGMKPYGNGFLLIGDAASLIDPLTGEGIGNSMWSAKLAAETIGKALKINDVSEGVLKDYEAGLSKGMRREMRTTYFFQNLLKYRFLVNFIIRKASRKNVIVGKLWALLNEDAKFPEFHLKVLKIILS